MKKKLLGLMLAAMLLTSAACSTAGADGSVGHKEGLAVVAFAWREDIANGVQASVSRMLEPLGVEYTVLDMVMYNGATYNGDRVSDECTAPSGMVDENCAHNIRLDWENSNVAEVVAARDFDIIVFSGGEDVSPSLQIVPDMEGAMGEGYNATRDISDYILMRYCLENDIPVLGICRGMQMLAVASGASMLQDIPAYYAEMGKLDKEYHRMPAGKENRDFVPHDVNIIDKNSLLYAIAQTDVIEKVPSWHHQSVLPEWSNIPLVVTATTTLDGIEIVEAVERTDLTFALGIQFHPEAIINNVFKPETDASSFMGRDECIALMKRLFDYVLSLKETEDAA